MCIQCYKWERGPCGYVVFLCLICCSDAPHWRSGALAHWLGFHVVFRGGTCQSRYGGSRLPRTMRDGPHDDPSLSCRSALLTGGVSGLDQERPGEGSRERASASANAGARDAAAG